MFVGNLGNSCVRGKGVFTSFIYDVECPRSWEESLEKVAIPTIVGMF